MSYVQLVHNRQQTHPITLSDAEPTTDDARPQWWQAAWDSVEVAGNPDEAAQTPKPAERIRLPRQKAR